MKNNIFTNKNDENIFVSIKLSDIDFIVTKNDNDIQKQKKIIKIFAPYMVEKLVKHPEKPILVQVNIETEKYNQKLYLPDITLNLMNFLNDSFNINLEGSFYVIFEYSPESKNESVKIENSIVEEINLIKKEIENCTDCKTMIDLGLSLAEKSEKLKLFKQVEKTRMDSVESKFYENKVKEIITFIENYQKQYNDNSKEFIFEHFESFSTKLVEKIYLIKNLSEDKEYLDFFVKSVNNNIRTGTESMDKINNQYVTIQNYFAVNYSKENYFEILNLAIQFIALKKEIHKDKMLILFNSFEDIANHSTDDIKPIIFDIKEIFNDFIKNGYKANKKLNKKSLKTLNKMQS